MSISGISNNSYDDSYLKISSGKRINSAADDAAGLAISQKLQSQATGYSVANKNAADGQNLINVAEGGMSSISDYLQRIRELGVQASNGTYTAEDKKNMQIEIDELKKGITDAAKGTEFNTMKLLDGSKADINLATNPSGTGMTIQMQNATLEELGIADFDVTKDFKLSDIDNAINKVSSSRASLGAQSNALDHTMNYNSTANVNLVSSQSRIEDANMAEEATKLNTKQVLEKYQYFAQKQQSQAKSGLLALFV